MIEVDHGAGYVTRYGHNKQIVVKVGDVVKQDDVIAKMGSTGRSTGPHVHFEVLRNGKKVNPRKYLSSSR
jgi:murein DD-endopeptidase MepM/ murein hydrolase activator NlpD